MEYLVAEFHISCDKSLLQTAKDLLADAVTDAGFESFEDAADGLKGYVQKSLFNKTTLDDILSDFLLPGTTVTYTLDEAENKDWNETWEEAGFEPIDIEGRVRVVDANHLSTAHSNSTGNDSKDVLEIKIAARQAFGTGTHQTTQMIIAELLHQDLHHKRVLDCGCGTGILAIAACKLGASQAVGYDIDEWSADNARHNAQLNHVDNLTVLLGDASVLNRVEGKFDIVLANINRNILLHDMTAFHNMMAEDALLVLSGFYVDDLPLLEAKAAGLGMKVKRSHTKDNWCCAVLG
mgnify:FL=1